MALAEFVEQLLSTGHLAVDRDPGDGAQLAETQILELDRRARLELADPVPPLVLPAATWALRLLERGSRYLVHREFSADAVREGLGEACPVPGQAPETLYSVDLGLRWLPDLIRLARGVAPDDPLVAGLKALAQAWPLSSIGVPGLEVGPLPDALQTDSCLRQLYVDRVIRTEALARLGDPAIADAVREAIGLYPHLSPRVARALELSATETS